MSTLKLGKLISSPSFSSSPSSFPLLLGTNLRVKFCPSLLPSSNHFKNLVLSTKYSQKVDSLKSPRLFRISCSVEAAEGSEVVVKEKSVSVILLAGGKGKRMGVGHSSISSIAYIFLQV